MAERIQYGPTTHAFFSGKTKWFRYQAPNEWGKWAHTLYLEGEDLEKFRELQLTRDGVQGIKNVLKKDEDGYFTTFSRPTERKLRTGRTLAFVPPMVYEPDGKTPYHGNVGNGSDVTTKIEVYYHPVPSGGKAKACRWVSSRIDNLVPWNKDAPDFNEREEKANKGWDKVPEKEFDTADPF